MAKQRKTRSSRQADSAASAGWRTTDADELSLRRQRGQVEVEAFEKLGERRDLFGTYRVDSPSGERYHVEIRSLAEPVNSCDCADHRVNGLGTCKHVEGVLHRLGRRRGFKKAEREGNPTTEVFLDRRHDRPAVLRAPRGNRRGRAEATVASFIGSDGRLIGPPTEALAKLCAALEALPANVRSRVRMSRHVADWLDEKHAGETARTARRNLQADLDAGRPVLDLLRVPLYPYQREGVLHLAFTRRAILADEMGLGKTIQAIAACELLARNETAARVLVVTPASLKGEWADQIQAFTPRTVNLISGSAQSRRTQYRRPGFFHLVSYEQVREDVEAINDLLAPDVVILDEAQRIKNWRTRTAMQVKRLRSPYAFVLTGTPLENRIDEVYSIVQFLDPAVFGPLFRFNRDFYQLDERGRPIAYRDLDAMHRRLQPIMLRRRKSEVEGELPGRSVSNHFVPMADEQLEQYETHQGNVARLVAIAQRRALRKQEFERLQQSLACMRMACDTPFILDRKTKVAPKLDELRKLLEELMEGTSSKAIVFSEWERMLVLARERTAGIAPEPAWHTGTTTQAKRRLEIRRFKEDPVCRVLFSTDSGSVGLNLQVADVVINLDLPWNPAKLEQRIARAWRKHQTRHVRVINLVTENTIEHRMLDTLEHKQRIADSVVDGQPTTAVVPLRSGRAALIERVASLTTSAETEQSAATASTSTAATPNLETRLRKALGEALIDVRQQRTNDGAATTLVVTDTVNDSIREHVARALAPEHDVPQPRVEIVDAATWRTIDRLVQAGILQRLEAPNPSPDLDAARRARVREQIARATKALEAARRQHAMARLLAGGGFEPESIAALRSASQVLAEALGVLAEDDETLGKAPSIANLGNRFDLPGDTVRHLTALEAESEGVDLKQCLIALDQALDAAARACTAHGELVA